MKCLNALVLSLLKEFWLIIIHTKHPFNLERLEWNESFLSRKRGQSKMNSRIFISNNRFKYFFKKTKNSVVTSLKVDAPWILFINIISPIYHSVFRLISSFLSILNTNFPSFSVYSFLQYEFLSAKAVPWRVLLLKRKLKFWKIFHTINRLAQYIQMSSRLRKWWFHAGINKQGDFKTIIQSFLYESRKYIFYVSMKFYI